MDGDDVIVRLSHYQARSVAARVSSLHRTALADHWVRATRTQRDYDLPAIAWRQILDELTRTCFGPAGGRLDRGVPKSAYSAIKSIADAVMRIENHPALREASVEGWIGDFIPVFIDPTTVTRSYSVYPYRVGGVATMVLLGPVHHTLRRLRITWWRATHWQPVMSMSWTFDPASHTMFLGASASPDSEDLTDQLEVEHLVLRETFPAAKARRVEDL